MFLLKAPDGSQEGAQAPRKAAQLEQGQCEFVLTLNEGVTMREAAGAPGRLRPATLTTLPERPSEPALTNVSKSPPTSSLGVKPAMQGDLRL